MRKNDSRELNVLAWTFVAAVFFAMGLTRFSYSDTGHEGATRIEVGSYVQTRSITVSTSASTELTDGASVKRPAETCMNNSAFTIWIGSNAAGTTLLNIGFPVLSSQTFKVGGMTGQVYGLADTSASTNVRCWDGLVR